MGSLGEEDILIFVFAWLLPSAGLSVMLGFSEQFGYDLRGCQPEMASWLRGVLWQYVLVLFLLLYFVLLPNEYWVYIKRFSQGWVWLALLAILIAEHLLVPWITLILHLRLNSTCGERMTQGQSIFYWIVFSLQTVLFLFILMTGYIFYDDFDQIVLHPMRQRKGRLGYAREVADILQSGKNLRRRYTDLLRYSSYLHPLLFKEEIPILRAILRRKISQNCVNILTAQRRICALCKGGFALSDRVHFRDHCGHLAHWQCFMSAITQKGQCAECGQGSVSTIKQSILAGEVNDLDKLLAVQPCVRPNFQWTTGKPVHQMVVQNYQESWRSSTSTTLP